MNSSITTPPAPMVGRESIVLGPGTAVPVPYFDPRAAESEPTGNLLWTVLHAVRRKWFAIGVVGLIVGCGASATAWYLVKPRFTASVVFKVPSRDESQILNSEGQLGIDFNLKRRTQTQTITGLSVLRSTLDQIDLAKAPEIRELPPEDQLPYLKSCVSASFPQDAEIMELEVECLDRATAMMLASKISEVYLKSQEEVVSLRRKQVDDLETTLKDLKEAFRKSQAELLQQERLAGPQSQSKSLTPAEQEQLQEYTAYWERRVSLEESIFQTRLQLAESFPDTEQDTVVPLVSEDELNAAVKLDQEIQALRERVTRLEGIIESADEEFFGQAYKDKVDSTRKEIATSQQQITDAIERLRRQLEVDKQRQITRVDRSTLDRRLAAQEAELEKMKQSVPTAPATAAAAGGGATGTVSIEFLRFEVEDLRRQIERVQTQLTFADTANLADMARQQEVGIRRADANVYVQDDDAQRRKVIQSAAAGGVAFVGVAALIVVFDLRRRRLNNTGDVCDQLQINVLGTVPLLRGKGSKRLEQSARLAEAVDGVAATLLCRTAGEDHRVVMISSAMAGEGKTTLAANLATSLASAGRRTLLVDFDLRRPMLHKVYQMPISPGLGELLSSRDLSDYAEYLQETTTEGLWLITAGAKRQRAIAELADARVAELFAAFKEHFEFIIVDGPPVLPVVDTRLVARHADGVVFSLLRDVSELPKVKAACQLLQSYRVTILGGVVIGATGDVYYGYPPERISNTA